MELTTLLMMFLGAGTKHAIGGLIGRFVPIPREFVPALVGAGLHFFGDRVHPLAKAYGTGLFVASVGELIARYVPALPAPAPARGGGGEYYNTPEEYLKAKYGI